MIQRLRSCSLFYLFLVSCLIILPTTPTSPTVFPRVNAISCKQWQAMKTQERNTIASNHFLASLLYSPAHLFGNLQSHHHLSTLRETFERSSRRWHVNDNSGINHFLCHKILTWNYFSTSFSIVFHLSLVFTSTDRSLSCHSPRDGSRTKKKIIFFIFSSLCSSFPAEFSSSH